MSETKNPAPTRNADELLTSLKDKASALFLIKKFTYLVGDVAYCTPEGLEEVVKALDPEHPLNVEQAKKVPAHLLEFMEAWVKFCRAEIEFDRSGERKKLEDAHKKECPHHGA